MTTTLPVVRCIDCGFLEVRQNPDELYEAKAVAVAHMNTTGHTAPVLQEEF